MMPFFNLPRNYSRGDIVGPGDRIMRADTGSNVMDNAASLQWTSSGRTDVGKVRSINEDALLERPEIGLWVVADGMGGHTAGDVASKAVVDSLRDLSDPERLSSFAEEVENRLIRTNTHLRELAARKANQTVGSTVVVLLAFRRVALCMWAGDSRIYRFRNGVLERLTQDHALVEELVEQGMLSPEEAEHHPQANLITRAVGATDDLYVDLDVFDLEAGDVYLLCSDGLTKEVSEADIAAILARDEVRASETLVEKALDHGAHDNTTVITVQIGKAADAPETA